MCPSVGHESESGAEVAFLIPRHSSTATGTMATALQQLDSTFSAEKHVVARQQAGGARGVQADDTLAVAKGLR